ncbi:MAG: N-acetylmuramoyl-L-alanine amidase [bacterium]
MRKAVKIISVFIFTLVFVKSVSAEMPKLKIIPRAGWGADEVLRFKNNEPVWTEEYADIKKIIIHHTAGSTGADNPMNTINAVYKWHARNMKWGDVGYNYLIDPSGAIYEGRYGGDGVIGAHAYDDSREIGWNSGTIGISILGTYGGWVSEPKQGYYLENPKIYPAGRVKNERLQNGKWQIYLEDGLSPQAEDSLTSLLAVKSLDFGFKPSGTSDFNNKDLPNIVGHRDVDYTACPGDILYNQMSSLRQRAQKKYDEIVASGIEQKATLAGVEILTSEGAIPQSRFQNEDIEVSLKKNETKEIILKFRNDGDLTWHNYTEDKIILADAGIKNKIAALDGVRLAVNANERELENESTLMNYQLVEPNVKSGEIGTFKVITAYPKDRLIDEKNLVLAMQDKGWFSGTDVHIAASAIDLSYKGEVLSQNLPVAIFENTKGEAVVKFKNTGVKAWYKEKGDAETGSMIYLKILDKTTGGKNKFYDKSWDGEMGLIKPEESEIMPGNFATFKFKYNILEPGFYRTQFTVMRKALELENSPEMEIMGSNYDTLTRVDSPIQAELVEAKVPSAMLNIWTSKAELKIKNTGIAPWETKDFAFKVINPDGSESPFKDASWKNGVVAKLPVKIMPGQMAIISVKLKAPKFPGIYHPTFKIEYKGKTMYISHNEQLIYAVRVDAAGK